MGTDDVSIQQVRFSEHEAAVTAALEEYHRWVAERFRRWIAERSGAGGATASDTAFAPTAYVEGELRKDVRYLRGADTQRPLIVSLDGDYVAGCVYAYRLGEARGEVKRLYVREAYRGRGLGRRLMDRLIEAATREGYAHLRLDTAPFMRDALGLYRELGFERTDGHTSISDIPAPLLDEITYMELSLGENR